jgi:hypothetical protein
LKRAGVISVKPGHAFLRIRAHEHPSLGGLKEAGDRFAGELDRRFDRSSIDKSVQTIACSNPRHALPVRKNGIDVVVPGTPWQKSQRVAQTTHRFYLWATRSENR